jgi:tetratricopeptide (TPR) repeat protein
MPTGEGSAGAATLAQLQGWRGDAARFIALGYFDRGWRRVARGEFEAALEDFERGLELDPLRLDAALERARLLVRLSRPEPAVAAFRDWLSRRPVPDAESESEIAAVRLEFVTFLSAQGRAREALAELDLLPPTQRAGLTSLRLRARLAQVIGEREVLLEAWLKWAAHPEASPGERVVLLDQSADLALALGRPEQALGLLEVLASRPEAPPLARRRALLLERLGERRAALGAWQLVLSEEQDAIARLAVVDVMLGHARALSDHRLERTLLLQALALSGQATDRLRDLTLFETRRGQLAEAARRALVLAAQSRFAADRALAFERIAALEGSGGRRSAPSSAVPLLTELDRLAARDGDPDLRQLIAGHHGQQGRDAEALAILESVARDRPESARRPILLQMADLHGRQADLRGRARALLEADRLPGPPLLSWSERVDAFTQLGRRESARAALEAERAAAPDDPVVLRRLIDLHREADDRVALLAGYQALARSERVPVAERAVAHREAAELARTVPDGIEVALEHYRQAIDLAPDHLPTRLALAEALVALGRDVPAARAFEALFRASREPEHALAAIRLFLAAGEPDAARALIDSLDSHPHSWHPESRFRFWTLRGQVDLEAGRVESAITAWERALTFSPDAGLSLRLRGLRARDAREQAERARVEGRRSESVSAWRLAESLEPEASSAQGLAYALLEANQPAQAAQAFNRALNRIDIPSAGLLADLGYAHLRAGERIEARAAFVRAIDTIATGGEPAGQTAAETMRREVRELDQTVRGALWQGWRRRGGRGLPSGSSGLDGAAGGAGAPASGGGIEIARREPLAHAPGRSPFEWFARGLWSLEPDTVRLNTAATQLGLGLRYRPAVSPDGWVSAERLFAVGGEGEDEWLFRAAWGRSWGAVIVPAPGWVGHLWADIAYLSASRTRALYGEWRQGYGWTLGHAIRLVPHAVFQGRGLDPDRYREAWLEAGLGLAIEGAAGGGRHVAPSVHWSTQLRYKFGLGGAGRNGWELGVSVFW